MFLTSLNETGILMSTYAKLLHATRRLACHAAWLVLTSVASTFSAPIWAQSDWPQRAITLIVPFGPGGIADVTARAVADAMSKNLGQTVVVDNRPSAGSVVASQVVASARPDGYTLLLMTNGHAVSANLFKNLSYDTVKDFQMVSTLGFFDLGIFTAPKKPYDGLKSLLDQAKAQPGTLAFGSVAAGSTQHLATVLFQSVADLDVLVVPYRTSPALQTALMAGEIDAALEVVGPMLGHVSAGTIKPLAVTGQVRNAALPDVPTVQELDIEDYNVTSWNAIAVPAATPRVVIERLNQAVREAMDSPVVQSRLSSTAMRFEASTPDAAQALLVREIARWGAVIRRSNIALE